MSKALSGCALLLAGSAVVSKALASATIEVSTLTDRIVLVHVDEGRVIYHQIGEPRTADRVEVEPLDTAAAMLVSNYRISSQQDSFYAPGVEPVAIHRKSKGTEFAWMVDQWIDGRAVNQRPDHAKEHWLYLVMPEPMKARSTYTIDIGPIHEGSTRSSLDFRFDPSAGRSEAVHVNLLGYAPGAPKFAYVYHWLGDGGSLDVRSYGGSVFELIDQASGVSVFQGTLKPRKGRDNPETLHVSDSPPHGSFLNADVYEADFSSFDRPGQYVVSVAGVGASFPFEIARDVLRPAYRAVMRGLYHNRSGIALTRPYTEFERPAPGHPKLTPGFADKLIYTTLRDRDYEGENATREALLASKMGTLEDVWGWYQDAGDWDSYYTHLNVAQHLLLAYRLAPENFADGENNIPESGNGVPDILDEAAWLPRFCHRLRHELMRKGWGTGGVGLRVAGDAFGSDEGTLADGTKVGRGSWLDNDRFYAVSGEDPWATYRYAGVAAQLALALSRAGVNDPEGVDWKAEAIEAYAWALRNTRDGDEAKGLATPRAYAAVALFELTGDEQYHQQFDADVRHLEPNTSIWWEDVWGPFTYALIDDPNIQTNPDLLARLRALVLHNADLALDVSERRALRWAGKWEMPMLIGQQTTPWAMELAVGETLTRVSDPARAARYRGAMHTSADFFLGTNALNTTWITGVGERFPTHIFHMDAWYNGKGIYHEGLIPYSPWRKEADLRQGPWDVSWAHNTVYPEIDAWPGGERWFSNRCSPMGSEFTVHQQSGPAAAFFGVLAGPAPR
jgi:hypothetical protein